MTPEEKQLLDTCNRIDALVVASRSGQIRSTTPGLERYKLALQEFIKACDDLDLAAEQQKAKAMGENW